MSVCVLGSLNLDIVCRVAELPRPGETVLARSLSRIPGGKGLNQAVAAARAGASTRLIGAVGADEAGRELLAYLSGSGVDVAQVAEIEGEPSGHAFINVSDTGENAIVVAGGANAALTPAHIAAAPLDGRTVFLSQLETPIAAVEALCGSEAAQRGLTILNAAPAAQAAVALFPLVDILVVNEIELAAYVGEDLGEPAPEAVARTARRLICRPGQTVIVTLGAAGAIAVTETQALLAKSRPARVVDTTGAGDCFCGALAAALGAGAPLAQALSFANAAAALSTETFGAGPSMPTRARVDAALRSQRQQ